MTNQEIVYSDGGAYNKFYGCLEPYCRSKVSDWLSPEADQKCRSILDAVLARLPNKFQSL